MVKSPTSLGGLRLLGSNALSRMTIPTGPTEGPTADLQCIKQLMTFCLFRQENGLRHVRTAFHSTGGSVVGEEPKSRDWSHGLFPLTEIEAGRRYKVLGEHWCPFTGCVTLTHIWDSVFSSSKWRRQHQPRLPRKAACEMQARPCL